MLTNNNPLIISQKNGEAITRVHSENNICLGITYYDQTKPLIWPNPTVIMTYVTLRITKPDPSYDKTQPKLQPNPA